ncbi:hypothetical protein NMY22_g16803 [Coprinellus aureogranulatus]|nr:hypothetical protein NMY22_g16803 [Coprinellus aureogranulatus]
MHPDEVPEEVWLECFQNASKHELKVLSTLSRRFTSIFQQLLLKEPVKTWPKPYYSGPFELAEHLLIDFFSAHNAGRIQTTGRAMLRVSFAPADA